MSYDLFAMSWERVEGLAQCNESLTALLADGEILYARTKEEAKRFLKLQETLKNNLQNQNFVFNKALEKVGAAKTLFEKLILEDSLSYVCKKTGGILNYLTEALAQEAFMRNVTVKFVSSLKQEVSLRI